MWTTRLLAIALALGLTAVVLQYSLRHGRLCTLPTFDDVSYMSGGLQRLQVFYDEGFAGIWRNYLRSPPHSPYSELLAMAAFALLGAHDWAPYVLNGLLAVALLLSADAMLRQASPWQRVLCLLFFATVPFVAMAVHEFRPDAAEALATALGVLVLLDGPLARSRWTHPFWAGVLGGIALLIKPTVFPATLVYFGAAFILGIFCDYFAHRQRLRPREISRAVLLFVVPAVVIALPHYVVDHRAIIAYIWDLEFGKHAASVAIPLPLRQKLLYYLSGPGAQPMLGKHVWILLPLAGGSLLWLWRRGKTRELLPAVALLLMLLLAYCICTQNPLKQPFLGLTFDVLLVLSTLRWLGELLRDLPTRPRLRVTVGVALAALMLLGLNNFQWPPRSGDPQSASLIEKNQIIERVYHDVLEHTAAPAPGRLTYETPGEPVNDKVLSARPRVLFNCMGDLSPDLLQYLAARDNASPRFAFTVDSLKLSKFNAAWDGADFVIGGDTNCGFFVDYLYCSRIQDELTAALRDRVDFAEIDAPRYSLTHKKLHVFQRISFSGWTPAGGFGPIEGPLADFDDRTVRWGLGPRSVLQVSAPQAAKYLLRWDARSYLPDQRMRVMLDGKFIAEASVGAGLGDPQHFQSQGAPLQLSAGQHEITLQYAVAQQQTDLPRAVLFRVLCVREDMSGK